RKDVAAVCVECLQQTAVENKTFEIISQGKRPDAIAWENLFLRLS
ncbi:MAG: SDR family NAD(P)-dependent oxidoreductase, partial [Symploca sp. SIO2G7]|nr:SDR family NAD(P)-dependent oxidoreductase [Symploca sp. SIO2G7]